jgi:hypothetical protein
VDKDWLAVRISISAVLWWDMGLVISSNKNQHFGCTFSGSLVVIAAAIYHFPIMLMIKRIRNFKG